MCSILYSILRSVSRPKKTQKTHREPAGYPIGPKNRRLSPPSGRSTVAGAAVLVFLSGQYTFGGGLAFGNVRYHRSSSARSTS
jgi:hypothetical protein